MTVSLYIDVIRSSITRGGRQRVIGVPDEDYGQRLAAFIVPQHGAAIEGEFIREHL